MEESSGYPVFWVQLGHICIWRGSHSYWPMGAFRSKRWSNICCVASHAINFALWCHVRKGISEYTAYSECVPLSVYFMIHAPCFKTLTWKFVHMLDFHLGQNIHRKLECICTWFPGQFPHFCMYSQKAWMTSFEFYYLAIHSNWQEYIICYARRNWKKTKSMLKLKQNLIWTIWWVYVFNRWWINQEHRCLGPKYSKGCSVIPSWHTCTGTQFDDALHSH